MMWSCSVLSCISCSKGGKWSLFGVSLNRSFGSIFTADAMHEKPLRAKFSKSVLRMAGFLIEWKKMRCKFFPIWDLKIQTTSVLFSDRSQKLFVGLSFSSIRDWIQSALSSYERLSGWFVRYSFQVLKFGRSILKFFILLCLGFFGALCRCCIRWSNRPVVVDYGVKAAVVEFLCCRQNSSNLINRN